MLHLLRLLLVCGLLLAAGCSKPAEQTATPEAGSGPAQVSLVQQSADGVLFELTFRIDSLLADSQDYALRFFVGPKPGTLWLGDSLVTAFEHLPQGGWHALRLSTKGVVDTGQARPLLQGSFQYFVASTVDTLHQELLAFYEPQAPKALHLTPWLPAADSTALDSLVSPSAAASPSGRGNGRVAFSPVTSAQRWLRPERLARWLTQLKASGHTHLTATVVPSPAQQEVLTEQGFTWSTFVGPLPDTLAWLNAPPVSGHMGKLPVWFGANDQPTEHYGAFYPSTLFLLPSGQQWPLVVLLITLVLILTLWKLLDAPSFDALTRPRWGDNRVLEPLKKGQLSTILGLWLQVVLRIGLLCALVLLLFMVLAKMGRLQAVPPGIKQLTNSWLAFDDSTWNGKMLLALLAVLLLWNGLKYAVVAALGRLYRLRSSVPRLIMAESQALLPHGLILPILWYGAYTAGSGYNELVFQVAIWATGIALAFRVVLLLRGVFELVLESVLGGLLYICTLEAVPLLAFLLIPS